MSEGGGALMEGGVVKWLVLGGVARKSMSKMWRDSEGW